MEFNKKTVEIMKQYMLWAKKKGLIDQFNQSDRHNLMELLLYYAEMAVSGEKNFAKKLGKKDKGRLEALKVYDQYIDKKKLEKIIGEIIDVEPEKKKKKKTAASTTADSGWVFTLNPFKIVDTILQSCFFQYRLWRNT